MVEWRCQQRVRSRRFPSRRVLSEKVVGNTHRQARDAGDDHRRPPPRRRGETQRGNEEGEHQRHDQVRYAAAKVSPAGRRGIGRADATVGEHLRRVVLSHDEGRADDPDRHAEEQEACEIMSQPNAHHRQRAKNQQPGVRKPRTDSVAQPSDEQPRQRGQRHRADDAPTHLILGESEFGADNRHQRCDAKPGEEAKKERHPGHVESPHGWCREL